MLMLLIYCYYYYSFYTDVDLYRHTTNTIYR